MLYKKYIELLIRKKTVDNYQIGNSYTKVSKDYEKVFLSTMHKYNNILLNNTLKYIQNIEGLNIVELACGTGYNTYYLNNKLKNAIFNICDISEGMIKEAERKLNLENVNIHLDDMIGFLKKQESESADVVVCTWAIKYQDPKTIIKECYRVLKKGGYLVSIVNKKSTLPEMRKIIPKIYSENVEKINYVMLELPNPISRNSFNKWFTNKSFHILKSGEGEHIFSFKSSNELIDFALSTGALAGYDAMLDLTDIKVRKQMEGLIDKHNIENITHKFVWGIYKK